MIHHCHALHCKEPCPARMLMCSTHWGKVSPSMQREVYRTVKLRGRLINETWAPWWRASHLAIYEVGISDGLDRPKLDAWLRKKMKFADNLEKDKD